MQIVLKQRSVIPGFNITLGFTITYLSLIVLIPLSMLVFKTTTLSWAEFWQTVASSRALAAYGLSVGGAMVAALVNGFFGICVAWCLVRYEFPGKKIIDGLVDLPFALPTAVAGIALAAIYAPTGWIGQMLVPLGVKAAYSRIGVVIAMVFVGLPFVIRTVQPVMEDLEEELEEAAITLGARRWHRLTGVVLPAIIPAWLAGMAMAFARAVGEYGSVIFIAGNLPGKTEIAPLLIMTRLEEFQYAQATAMAVGLLLLSFTTLFLVNTLQAWAQRRVNG